MAPPTSSFNDDRYSRQIRFAPFGEEGQSKLGAARVAIVGCGALGSFQAAALARSGAGFLRLIDRDFVELNNLQRQWLYDESDARQALPKAVAAARSLTRANSRVLAEPQVADLTPANIADLLSGIDLVLDGSDNFETRYLVNDYCILHGIPWIYGAALGSYGLTMPILPGETACLACVHPEPPSGAQPTCETAGVLNTITAIIAALQVSAAMQILSGHQEHLNRSITTVDVWTGSIRQLAMPAQDPQCRVCALRDLRYLDGKQRAPISLCGRNAVQIHERSRPVSLESLANDLKGLGEVRRNEFALRFWIAPYEMTIFPDGRAIIKGTTDPGVARSLYARYVGA